MGACGSKRHSELDGLLDSLDLAQYAKSFKGEEVTSLVSVLAAPRASAAAAAAAAASR